MFFKSDVGADTVYELGTAGNDATVVVLSKNSVNKITRAKCTTVPSAKAGYAIGCELTKTDTGAKYQNTGTAASCTFTLLGTTSAGSVGAAQLATAVLPSHVIKFAGTASGGTTASRAYTITGALSTDVATAVIRASTNAASIQKAVLTSDTLTVTFSTDPGASTTVDYTVSRAIA